MAAEWGLSPSPAVTHCLEALGFPENPGSPGEQMDHQTSSKPSETALSLTGVCMTEQERKGDFTSTDLDFHGA